MITFASLFLSLVIGTHPVELWVDEPVALVEIRLDGKRVGVLTAKPWSFDCDFGQQLLPHELVAIAYDGQRREIGRVRQWVNLPRSPAEAALFLERDGGKTYARLTWKNVIGSAPESIEASFDGSPIPVADLERIELPRHDLEQLHFLRAELEFADNVSSVAEMTFGGYFADQTRTELTAVPVQLKDGVRLPRLEDLQERFLKNDRPLTVVATEEGPATVLVVRDENARETLASLGLSRRPSRSRSNWSTFGRGAGSLRDSMLLHKNHKLVFLWPFVHREQDPERQPEVFDLSPPFSSKDGGMHWLLSNVLAPAERKGEQRLADAVAVAGVVAARRNRRRSVLLILDGVRPDPSRLTPSQVRRYLDTLMVPFFVWSSHDRSSERGERGATSDHPWGETRDISSLRKLELAVKELNRQLDRQRLVWLEGIHLPQEISLTDSTQMGLAR